MIQDVKDFFFWDADQPEHRKKHCIRVTKSLAKELLLNDETIIIGGNVKWFNIVHIGLDVYEVYLNNTTKNTGYRGKTD